MNHTFKKSKPYSASRGCPEGYHKREGYKSSKGEYVPARCVRATTTYKESSKQMKARVLGKQTRRVRLHLPSIRSLLKRDCPPGMIPRKSYVRRYTTAVREKGFTVRRKDGKVYRVHPKSKSTLVKSRCIKDLGKPGRGVSKGKGLGPLRKGELAKHGYSFRVPEGQRRAALKSAVEEFGALGVYRKLNAVAKLTSKTIPDAAKVFGTDRNWLKSSYSLKAF